MATSTTAPRRNCKISSTGSGDRSGSEATPPAQVPSRLAGIDGEFIAVFLDERSTVTTVITDALGRLPIYIGTHEEGVCLSRGLEVAADAGTPDREYDRLAIAQRLCFGYPLGTRTALENVRKPRPAAWIAFRPAGEVTADQYHTIDLGVRLTPVAPGSETPANSPACSRNRAGVGRVQANGRFSRCRAGSTLGRCSGGSWPRASSARRRR